MSDLFEQALNAYTQIEVAKANSNASGTEHTQQKTEIERASGSAVALEPTRTPVNTMAPPQAGGPFDENFYLAGVPVNKKILVGSVGLLGLAVVAKKLKLF